MGLERSLGAAVLIAGAILAAALGTSLERAAERGLALGPLAADDIERGRRLDQALAALAAARGERCLIVVDLKCERIDLDEAIDRARPLPSPTLWSVLHMTFPRRTDDELLAYQLLVAADAECDKGRPFFIGELVRQVRARFGEDALVPRRLEQR